MNPETLQEQHSRTQWNPADADKHGAIHWIALHSLDVLRHCAFLSLVFRRDGRCLTSVSDSSTGLYTVKQNIVYCNEAESSNSCLGKAFQHWEEFLWERKLLLAELQTQMW